MFPFLAPIKTPNHVERIGTRNHFVEMTFLVDSPFSSRAQSAASQIPAVPKLEKIDNFSDDSASNKSRSSEGLNKSSSRPNSQIAFKKSSVSSLPTSARSEGKSSPVPVKDTVPPPSRHKNKGLQMSAGMMDIFGGAGEPSDTTTTYTRKPRGTKNLAQPGPEWFEGFEKLDVSDLDLPDPNCPAEKVLRGNTSSTCDSNSTWNANSNATWNPSLPGPDIGAGVEEDEQIDDEEEVMENEQLLVESKIAEDSKEGHPPPSSHSNERRESTANAESADTRRESTSDRESADGESAKGNESKRGQKSGSDGGGGMPVLLIRNAQVINDDAIFVADVLVEDGVISNVAPNLDAPDGAEIIDASGKMLLPAGIDVYTQITSESSSEDLSTGCKAALAGGTTTIVEVVRAKSSESILAAVKRVKSQLSSDSVANCHVALSVAISDFSDSTRSELGQIIGSEGVNSIVLDGINISDEKIVELFEFAAKQGVHVRVIPENKSIISILERKMLKLGVTGPEGFPQSRPESLEAQKTGQACIFSGLTNCPISIISLSSEGSLEALEQNSDGLQYAEISSVALGVDGSGYYHENADKAASYLLDVPLRKNAKNRLLSSLATLPLVQVSSGHKNTNGATSGANFTQLHRGSPGAQERLSLVWEKAVRTGKIDPMKFTAITSTNAAKIFNLYPKKGRIAVGADADLVIFESCGARHLAPQIYQNIPVHSNVFATILAGKVVASNGELLEQTNGAIGGFLALTPNSPYLFSVVGQREKFPNVEKIDRAPAPTANGQNGSAAPSGTKDFDRNRQKVMESSIGFGGNSQNRPRNPPGGRTTGFW